MENGSTTKKLSMSISRSLLSTAFVLNLSFVGCSQHDDSCSDLAGTITHTSTEITGIGSISVFKRNTNASTIEAIDQFTGTEFSNLIIELNLSWVEEQHRFRQTNTFMQSFLDWFVSPVMACSLAPYYEEYQPGVSSIQVFSDSDFNQDYTAGTDLTSLFAAAEMMGASNSLLDANDNNSLLSARTYSLEPVWLDGELVTRPTTPSSHIFTIMISLSDGSAYEIRTPELLLSGS